MTLTINHLNTIVSPLITEKSTTLSESGKVAFYVRNDASKPEIKQAVESLFKVKVKTVNTILTKGKEKRFRGTVGRRSDYKKAIVTLENGQNIDISSGV